jgi:hypothetical protein
MENKELISTISDLFNYVNCAKNDLNESVTHALYMVDLAIERKIKEIQSAAQPEIERGITGEPITTIANLICDRDNGHLLYSELIIKIEAALKNGRITVESTARPAPKTKYHTESWYDRHTRSYVTQLKDECGNQIGDAAYDGTKAGRDISVSEFNKKCR